MAKQKSNSVAGVQKAIEAVQEEIKPPRPLGKKASVYWGAIITRRAKDEWTPVDLLDAVRLCELSVDLDAERNKLNREGRVISSDKGPKRNPRDLVVDRLGAQILRLKVHLRIHPASDHASPRTERGQREAERFARELGLQVPSEASPFLPFGGQGRTSN